MKILRLIGPELEEDQEAKYEYKLREHLVVDSTNLYECVEIKETDNSTIYIFEFVCHIKR